MALKVPDLLTGGGSTAVLDAQGVSDSTDWQCLDQAGTGYAVVGGDSNRTPPSVVPNTATVTGPASTTTLTSLTGSTTLTVSGLAGTGGIPTTGGYFSVTSSGGGTAIVGFASSNGTTTLVGCYYITGGSGNIPASATLSIIMAVHITAGWIWDGPVTGQSNDALLSPLDVSVQNIGGTAFQALPASTTDRKDLLCINTASFTTAVIVQGSPCGTLDWTRNNGSYTAPPPLKPAIPSAYIPLTEITVPGQGSVTGNDKSVMTTGQLWDKSVRLSELPIPEVRTVLGGDYVIVNASTEYVAMTTASLPIGTYRVTGQVQLANGEASAVTISFRVQPTASGGYTSGTSNPPAGGATVPAGGYVTLPINGTVQVTAAGTADLRVESGSGGGSSLCRARASDQTTGWSNVTQLIFTRISQA